MLVILCCVCSRFKSLDAAQLGRVRQWFWRSAFSERYRVGGEGFVTRDVEAVSKFIGDGGSPSIFGEPPTAAQLAQATFRINNSRTRAFILALASMRPRNLTNGAQIDTAEALSQFNKKQFHHVHPKAHLKRAGTSGEANSLANICMLAASENNLISDSDPREYVPELLKGRNDGDSVLTSNLMPTSTALDYSKASYPDFLSARAEIVAKCIADLCDGGAHK